MSTTKKPKLGTGERFKQLTQKLAAKEASNPKALAAWIGRKKYGKKRFAELAAKGKKVVDKNAPVKRQKKHR